jgi:hypothetical protein
VRKRIAKPHVKTGRVIAPLDLPSRRDFARTMAFILGLSR